MNTHLFPLDIAIVSGFFFVRFTADENHLGNAVRRMILMVAGLLIDLYTEVAWLWYVMIEMFIHFEKRGPE